MNVGASAPTWLIDKGFQRGYAVPLSKINFRNFQHYLTYDAENHMVTASSGGTYVYDGEGKRVKRTASSQEWWYVYGIGGELVAEYLSTATTTVKKEYGYRGGQLLVVWDADKSGDERLKWLVSDHLGSTRMEADKSGSLSAMVRHDYLPFGEELAAGIRGSGYGYVSTNVRQKFTGYERDNETGLDFAEARYFASAQGRFTGPDLPFADQDIVDPRSWNLYIYVRNNPLRLIDPTGRKIWIVFEETTADGTSIGQRVEYRGGKLYGEDGKEYKGNNSYAKKVASDLDKLKTDDKVLAARLNTLERSKQTHYVEMVDNPGDGNRNDPHSPDNDRNGRPTGTTTKYDPDNPVTASGDRRTPRVGLAHEMLGHAYDSDQGLADYRETRNGIRRYEVNAVNVENRARAATGDPKRTAYGGRQIPRRLIR